MTIFSLMHHFEINTSLLLLIFVQAKYNNLLLNVNHYSNI